jgi:flagellar hook-length control protein FliK
LTLSKAVTTAQEVKDVVTPDDSAASTQQTVAVSKASETTSKLSATQTAQTETSAATTAAEGSESTSSIMLSQTFTTTTATFVAQEKNTAGSNFDTNSDTLSEGKTAASFNASTSNAVSAEGAQASGTYNFASTLSAARALNGGTVGLPSVVDQVILQMNRNVKNGNDQMSLQLQPGDLGKITVKLNFGTDGKVQGMVTADNPQTLNMLQKDSRSLERALQDAGLRADPGSLQFSLNGQSGQNSGQTAQNGNQANGPGNGTVPADTSLDGTGLVDISSIAETYYITPTGVNIQV